jgi:hypothetical protein
MTTAAETAVCCRRLASEGQGPPPGGTPFFGAQAGSSEWGLCCNSLANSHRLRAAR